MPKNNKPWERQKCESAQAYEAFSLYLEMGNERSIRRVEQELHKSHALIGRWSSKYEWTERIREYTNELKKQEIEEAKKNIKDMQKRQIQTALLLQKKAVKALESLDISSLSPREILQFISEGTRIESDTRKEIVLTSEDGEKAGNSLASEIIAAYEKRKGSGGK